MTRPGSHRSGASSLRLAPAIRKGDYDTHFWPHVRLHLSLKLFFEHLPFAAFLTHNEVFASSTQGTKWVPGEKGGSSGSGGGVGGDGGGGGGDGLVGGFGGHCGEGGVGGFSMICLQTKKSDDGQ